VLAIPISSPGGQGERGLCAADVMINVAVAASAQVSRRMIIGCILDFQSWRISAYMPASVSPNCGRDELVVLET
jgi:hypothetical protein